MISLLKRLLPQQLPSHIHFHFDDHGNEIWCDESVCRPQRPPLLLPPIR